MVTTSPAQLQPGPTALYAQLAGILRDRIYSGSWEDGNEIPTIQELSERYGVARVTVRQAIQILSAEGLLSSHRGRRTFVTYSPTATDIRPLFSSIGAMNSNPSDYSIKVLSIEPFDALPVRQFLRGVPMEGYFRVRKLDSDRGLPYSLSESFIAASVFRRFPQQMLEKVKIARLVRDYSDPPATQALERISMSAAAIDEAESLKTGPAAPVARLGRMFLGPREEILLYGNYVYRGDRFLIERDISDILK